jgi:hypothetical protein
MSNDTLKDALADAQSRRLASASGASVQERDPVMEKLAKYILATGVFTLACTIMTIVVALSRMSRTLFS